VQASDLRAGLALKVRQSTVFARPGSARNGAQKKKTKKIKKKKQKKKQTQSTTPRPGLPAHCAPRLNSPRRNRMAPDPFFSVPSTTVLPRVKLKKPGLR